MFLLPLVVWYIMCWPWFSYILAWTGFKPREETHCFYAPVLPHLTLEMSRNRFGEGVAGLCLHTLRHAWLGTWIRLVPSGKLCRWGMRLCLHSAGPHSRIAWECKVRRCSLPPRVPFDSWYGPLLRPAEGWAQWVSHQSFNWLQNEKL